MACPEHFLRHDTPSLSTRALQEDRIRRVGDGVEQRVLNFPVDGIDAQEHSVYEFHGCLLR